MDLIDTKKRSDALDYCYAHFGEPIPDEKPEGEDEKYWSYVRQYRSDDDKTSLKTRREKMESQLDNIESRLDKIESGLASLEQSRTTLLGIFVKAQGKTFVNLKNSYSDSFLTFHLQLNRSRSG